MARVHACRLNHAHFKDGYGFTYTHEIKGNLYWGSYSKHFYKLLLSTTMLYYYYYIINDYGTLTSEKIASGGQELKLWAPKLMDRSLVSTELKETMSKRVVNWTEVIEELKKLDTQQTWTRAPCTIWSRPRLLLINLLSMRSRKKMASKPEANPSCAIKIYFIDYLVLANFTGDCTALVIVQ